MRISDWSSDVCSSDLGNRRLLYMIGGRFGSLLGFFMRRRVRCREGLLYRLVVTLRLDIGVVDQARQGSLESQLSIGQFDAVLRTLGAGNRRYDRRQVQFKAFGITGFGDRKSVVEGKRVSVRGDLGGRRSIKKKTKKQ